MVQKRWLRLMVVWLVPVSVLMAAAVGVGADEAAKDFTFTVPVKFQSMSENLKFIRVVCTVWESENRGTSPWGVGKSSDIAVPPSGILNQDVVVTFNIASGKDKTKVTTYDCTVDGYMTEQAFASVSAQAMTAEWCKVRPGAVVKVTGSLRP